MWWRVHQCMILGEITMIVGPRAGYNLPSRNTKRPQYILIKRNLLCKIQADSARDYGKNEGELTNKS